MKTKARELVDYITKEFGITNQLYVGKPDKWRDEYYDTSGYSHGKTEEEYNDIVVIKKKDVESFRIIVSHNTDFAKNKAIRLKNLLLVRGMDGYVSWTEVVRTYIDHKI